MAKAGTTSAGKGASSASDELLADYRAKRDFSRTREPDGSAIDPHDGNSLYFCVQKHSATRLHYDFRVEMDGVLKSWAVTKGPSLDPATKRLAVRTEDHPLDYGDFEGTIPKKEYGGGTVMLWDRGSWEPQEDAQAGLAAGNLKMKLFGERMKGNWVLVRMDKASKGRRENWLLIKEKDDVADRERDILSAATSVKSGRAMEAIAKDEEPTVWHSDAPAGPARGVAGSKKAKAAAKAAAPKPRTHDLARPKFVAPQLATLVSEAPEAGEWLHEMKYDGYRVLIAVGKGGTRCYTRNEKDWTDKFAAIAEAAEALSCDSALIDGEVVAFDKEGGTDFSTLQHNLSEGGPLACFCFDLLSLDGEDLRKEPLTTRKRKLKTLIRSASDETLLYSEHVSGGGSRVLESLCEAGHEGIVSKRADAAYRSGRSTAWLKTKCTRRQEFVIGGFSPSDKKARAFSSILVGVMESGGLLYRGRVGSGFSEATLDELSTAITSLSRKTSPFADLPGSIARASKFVTPRLVAEIEFAELTADGHIRHGVFKGLREDKDAEAVVDETPKDAAAASDGSRNEVSAGKSPGKRAAARSDGKATIAGIAISHPDRILYEGQGITKRDLAAYYDAVAPAMLRFAGRRPLSLVRCPGGRKKACFFQKHGADGLPDEIRTISIDEKDGGTDDYLYVMDAAGLVGAVQMGTLEFHIWGSRIDRLERPDRLVFDLDPDESLAFADVRRAAAELRAGLEELGLETFAMVTGGKGVHLIAPLERRQDWDELKRFAKGFAARCAEADPERYVATMSKARRKGRIFIDWLRNERGSTAIAPYSTRSRAGAPVAVPVSWDELATLERADAFSLDETLKRLRSIEDGAPDPWQGYDELRQSVTRPMVSAVL